MLRETGAATDAALSLARALVQLASDPDAAAVDEAEIIGHLEAMMRSGSMRGLDAAAVAQAVRMLKSRAAG